MRIEEIMSRIKRCLTERPERNPKEIKICIDPGHGGKDSGAVRERGKIGLENVLEEDINLEVANRLAWLCARHKVGYLMSRWGDRYISLKKRCQQANQSKAEVFISIHCNSVKSHKPKGLEVFHCTGSGTGKRLASICFSHLKALNYTKIRGVKKAKFYVLRHTKMSAILIELGFISNKEDMKYLINENNQMLIASKIFEFIREICINK